MKHNWQDLMKVSAHAMNTFKGVGIQHLNRCVSCGCVSTEKVPNTQETCEEYKIRDVHER